MTSVTTTPLLVSLSAPPTTLPSRMTSPRARKTESLPTSPRARGAGIAKKASRGGWQLVKNSITVPQDALRTSTPAATFGKASLLSRTSSVASLTTTPIHSYIEPLSTLKTSGVSSFGKCSFARGELPTHGPDVHSYAQSLSTLKTSGVASFGSTPSRSKVPTHGPDVHSYAEPLSTLKTSGATAFSMDKSARTTRPLTHGPAVHSYLAAQSTFTGKGGVAFGSTAARSGLPVVSRSGLASSTSTPLLNRARAAVSTDGKTLSKTKTVSKLRDALAKADQLVSEVKTRPESPVDVEATLALTKSEVIEAL